MMNSRSLYLPIVATLRRLSIVAVAICAVALPHTTIAQELFPSKPVHIVVPVSAGGATDVTARLLAQHLSRRLATTFVVENKAGAAGTIGMGYVAKARPDGYTLAWTGPGALTITPILSKAAGYHPIDSFEPVGYAFTAGMVVYASPSLRVATLPELVALGKSNPTRLSFGSSGNGSSVHLMGELLKTAGGFDALHVPFKGSVDGMNAVLSGNVGFAFDALNAVLPHIQAGKLVPLAVTGSRREAALPSVPTVAEQGFASLTAEYYFGLLAPAQTPESVLQKLAEALKQSLAEPELRKAFEATGTPVNFGSPSEFKALIGKDVTRWTSVIRDKGITAQ